MLLPSAACKKYEQHTGVLEIAKIIKILSVDMALSRERGFANYLKVFPIGIIHYPQIVFSAETLFWSIIILFHKSILSYKALILAF